MLIAVLVSCSGGGHDDTDAADASDAVGTDDGEPAAEEASSDPTEAWLESLVSWGFRGAVALVDGDAPVVASGFGALDPEGASGAIGMDTRFAIGSITKDFVDLAILLLQDRGQLDTGDRLGDMLPDVPPDKAAVTVDQLMAHTAGFEDVHGEDDEQMGREEALARIFGQELLFEPGTDESYSNSGYTLLAAIIEEVSGQALEDFLRQEIFEPAGMDNTGFKGDPVPEGRDEAVGLNADDQAVGSSERGPIGWTLRGNGGVVSSVNDLLAFDRAVCGDVLPDAVVRQLPYCGETGAFGTAGGGSAFSHTASWEKDLDSGMELIVLSAEWEFPAEEMAFALIDHVLNNAQLPAVPEVGEVAAVEIAGVTGTYESDAGAIVTVTVEEVSGGIRLATEDSDAFDDLFDLPDEVPEIARIDEVVRLVQDPEVVAQIPGWDDALSSLVELEPIGVAPVDQYEPQTFLKAHLEEGSMVTAWVFSPDGEWLYGELDAEPPGVTFRPGVNGDFVSFTLGEMPIADRVTFEDGTMTIHIGGRAVDYRREG